MRRLIAILVIVAVLAAAWVGGWFWLAGWVDRNADGALREVARRGIDVECPDRAIVGFPFAIRVSCGATAVADRSTETRASLAGATGGASVFRPTTAEIALQSPVRVESPLLEGPLELRWNEATVDLGMGTAGPRDAVFDATKFVGAFALPGAPEQTVTAERAEARLAPSASGGSTVSVTFSDLAFASGGTRFPPVSGSASGELSVPPRVLAAGPAALDPPVEARGIQVTLESGGAHFMLEGDIAVSAEGLLDGTMILRVAGAEALPDVIAALPDRFQRVGNAVAAGLFAFGQPTTLDGRKGSEVRVAIESGRASIGPIAFDLPRVQLKRAAP